MVSPAHHGGWHGAGAAGAPRRASRHRRPAPRRPDFAPRAEGLGGLLAAYAGTARDPQRPHRHRPYAGSIGLEPVTTRRSLCPPGHGRLRSAVPRADDHPHGPTRQGLRFYPAARSVSGLIRAATAVRYATAVLLSAQALGHHIGRGPGQRCVRKASPQRVSPAKRGKAASTSQTTSHCPPEPSNLIGKFLGRLGCSMGCRWRLPLP